jgi:hypothetical protein
MASLTRFLARLFIKRLYSRRIDSPSAEHPSPHGRERPLRFCLHASDIEAGMLAGANAYLVKPDSSELIPIIRRLLEAAAE